MFPEQQLALQISYLFFFVPSGSLLNSNVSLPFLSVLTGRGGYSLGCSVTGVGVCRGGGSVTSGRAGGGAAAAAGLHLALDWALRRPPVLVEHWEAGASLSSMAEESGHHRPNPVEFLFYLFSQFLCH